MGSNTINLNAPVAMITIGKRKINKEFGSQG
jgi:hypothetical protein